MYVLTVFLNKWILAFLKVNFLTKTSATKACEEVLEIKSKPHNLNLEKVLYLHCCRMSRLINIKVNIDPFKKKTECHTQLLSFTNIVKCW